MAPTRLSICTATLVLMAAVSATAEPAYVPSNVNLRSGAGTGNAIVAKTPGGSRVDAANCTDWCEVEWQGKKGFVIANALDRSGRAPAPRKITRRAPPRHVPRGYFIEDDYVPVGPPVVYGGPYYYGYRPYYRGYGPRWGFGYRRGYWRW